MEIRDRRVVQEVAGLFEIRIRLPREPDQDIRAERGRGESTLDAVEQVGETGCPVRPPHEAEDAVASALQRNVKVGSESAVFGCHGYDFA